MVANGLGVHILERIFSEVCWDASDSALCFFLSGISRLEQKVPLK